MRFVFAAFVFFAACSFVDAQAYRVDPTPVLTTAGNCAPNAACQALLVPGATIAVCSYPDCSVPITAYTDASGTTACPTFAPVTLPPDFSCSQFSDPQGNFGFWAEVRQFMYTITLPNGQVFGPFPVANIAAAAGGTTILYLSDFPGSDCGVQANNAYAALPATGGEILVTNSACSFTHPIVFGTNGKPVVLHGIAGGAVTMNYTASTGTAITLDYGTFLTMGKGVRDLLLNGPGSGTATTGVQIGLTNGAQGSLISETTVQGFGTGVTVGDQTWIVKQDHNTLCGNGTNYLYPAGLTNSGENMQYDHVTFCNAPAPHTNSVILHTGEHSFISCSFDQAQLVLGDGSVGAQVNMSGSRFEDPNYASPGAVDYTYIVVNNNNANYLRLSNAFFEQDRSGASGGGSSGNFPQYMSIGGGVTFIDGLGSFSPIPVNSIMLVANAANINLFAYNDLGGNAGALYSGSTTGFLLSFPGANTANNTGFNSLIGTGTLVGGAPFSVAGNVEIGTMSAPANLAVLGNETVGGTLNVAGLLSVSNIASHTVTGNLAVTGTTTLQGATVVNGSFTANGSVGGTHLQNLGTGDGPTFTGGIFQTSNVQLLSNSSLLFGPASLSRLDGTAGGATFEGAVIINSTLNASGAISGTHLQNLGTGDGPTFTGGIFQTSNVSLLSGTSLVFGPSSLSRLDGTAGGATFQNTVLINSTLDVTGTATASGYIAGSSTGLSCSGTPTSSFASVGGIVTHC